MFDYQIAIHRSRIDIAVCREPMSMSVSSDEQAAFSFRDGTRPICEPSVVFYRR